MFDLKPCPFCGSIHISIQSTIASDGKRVWQAYCIPCWANRGWFDSEEQAADQWNKREGY